MRGPTAGRPIPHMTDADLRRFWEKVSLPDPETGCMEWLASTRSTYGQFRIGPRSKGPYAAHRVSYVLAYGEHRHGLVLDHLCVNPRCVNPDHLEPVSVAVNVRRGPVSEINRAKAKARTHCKRGHEISDENTYTPPGWSRRCRVCARDDERARYHTRKKGGIQ